jgi:hypothetical protein
LEWPKGVTIYGYLVRSRFWSGGITYSVTVEGRQINRETVRFRYFNLTKKETETLTRRLDEEIKKLSRPSIKKKK